MRRTTLMLALTACVSVLVGCGSTIGDPCTTPDDCGGQLCINRDYTPGGYCSRQCDLTNAESCPSGARCIAQAGGNDLNACLRECGANEDCRNGYVCRRVRDSQFSVCVGPEGI